MTYTTTTTAINSDPRCPFCGRPVIGNGIVGNEGTYHPECTRPPITDVEPWPVPVNPTPWIQPYIPPQPWNIPYTWPTIPSPFVIYCKNP